MIRFEPDGAIDENSIQQLLIKNKDGNAIPIIEARNRLSYEIGHKTNVFGAYYP